VQVIIYAGIYRGLLFFALLRLRRADFAPVPNLLPLFTTTKLNSVVPPGEYV